MFGDRLPGHAAIVALEDRLLHAAANTRIRIGHRNTTAAPPVVNMKSEAGPRTFFSRKMAGKLRFHYEWVAGWTLVRIKNLDFKEQ